MPGGKQAGANTAQIERKGRHLFLGDGLEWGFGTQSHE
jgi:hypothetical protein